MNRTYIFRSLGISRGLTGLAAVAVGAVLAGCGSGGGSTTPAAGASAAATPVVSSGGVQAGGSVQAQTGGGSSGGGTAVAGAVSGGGNAGTISSGGSTGGVSVGKVGSVSTSSSGSFSQTSAGSVESATQVKQQVDLAAKTKQKAPSNTVGSSTTTTAETTTPPKSVTVSKPQTTSTPAKTPTTTKPVVRYVTRYKTHTVYLTRTQTVTKTVVKQVRPDVPAGAYLPSKHPELAQSSFTVSGSNIGCEINGASVRCGIQQRAWAAPVQPASCKQGNWGDTIQLGGDGLAKFACGGSNPISANAKVIPAGWDDKFGRFTCQIRSFGVNCFSTSNSGLMISRTGYSLY